jgi:hypothetical protein
LPQPTVRTTQAARAAIPTQRRSTTSLSRHLAEQDWTTLVATWRLLSRLTVERTKHGFGEDADAFARDSAAVEDDLERTYGARWNRLLPRLQAELGAWWAESHGSDPRTCTGCRVQNRPPDERITVPPPGRPWFP